MVTRAICIVSEIEMLWRSKAAPEEGEPALNPLSRSHFDAHRVSVGLLEQMAAFVLHMDGVALSPPIRPPQRYPLSSSSSLPAIHSRCTRQGGPFQGRHQSVSPTGQIDYHSLLSKADIVTESLSSWKG